MLIDEAKRKAVGTAVTDLDVVVTTAGTTEQVDKTLPKKQSKQAWTQKLGITDTSAGHTWAVVSMDSYKPIVKGWRLIIKDARVDEFTNKGGDEEKRLLIDNYEIPTFVGEPPPGKDKFEGVLDPIVHDILAKYGIATTDALWPCTHKNKPGGVTTNWVIFHRYCEQIQAKAGIIIYEPKIVKDGTGTDNEIVLLVTGQLGHAKEWTYGEASSKNTKIPYPWAIAEKRGKDRLILKLAGFHGMVHSEFEADWGK